MPNPLKEGIFDKMMTRRGSMMPHLASKGSQNICVSMKTPRNIIQYPNKICIDVGLQSNGPSNGG